MGGTPCDLLMRDHRELCDLMAGFEKALDRESADLLQLWSVALEGRLDLHRRKEEEVLFPALERRLPPPAEAIGTLRRDHAREEAYFAEFRALLRRAHQEGSCGPDLLAGGRRLLAWLRDHMWKEENFLFRDADALLSEEERRQAAARMEALEGEAALAGGSESPSCDA